MKSLYYFFVVLFHGDFDRALVQIIGVKNFVDVWS